MSSQVKRRLLQADLTSPNSVFLQIRFLSSTAKSMTERLTINVGGRSFTTLKATLEQSPFLNAMLSDQWAHSSCGINGTPFVDRSPILFEHVLNFL